MSSQLIRIPADAYNQVKEKAHRERITMISVVGKAVRQYLATPTDVDKD